MSVHISSRAWLVQGISFAEKLVLLKLADMANDEGVCWPSNATIAAQCGLDARSVRRIVARLEGLGLVKRQAKFRPGGLQATNWLTVLPPADRRAAAAPEAAADCESVGADVQGGDSPVLPARGDSPVLPGGTPRSSLGGTPRSSKPSKETSKKHARVSAGRASARSASSRVETSRALPAAKAVAALAASLSKFQADRLLSGQVVLIDGKPVRDGSPLSQALRQALRAQVA